MSGKAGEGEEVEAGGVDVDADALRRMVTKPRRPSVAMKAKASGTPAKFEATPLKVISVGRTQPGRPPRSAAIASAKPISAPRKAEATLISMLSR